MKITQNLIVRRKFLWLVNWSLKDSLFFIHILEKGFEQSYILKQSHKKFFYFHL